VCPRPTTGSGWSPDPLGEEQLLSLTLVRKIPAENRPEHMVGLEAIVEGVNQPVDHGLTTNAVENGPVPERPKTGRGNGHPAVGQVRIDE
jgi:hypothetical protein